MFASDTGYRSEPFPIRSGYFFNPAGTYSFTITTDIYNASPDATEEHRQLVEAMIASFRYESNMVYINASKRAVTINGTPVSKSGTTYAPAAGYATVASSPLVEIRADRAYMLDSAEELIHNYSRSGTDPRLRRVLEGYTESGTRGSMDNYKYAEYVHNSEKVYKVTETTRVTITVNPRNQKLYTHPQMKNGNYTVRAYFTDVRLNTIGSLGYNSAILGMTLSGVAALDRIDIKVVGSMYDDVR